MTFVLYLYCPKQAGFGLPLPQIEAMTESPAWNPTPHQAHTGRSPVEAAHWLRSGHCIGMPTETVYGLAANALDQEAVWRIFDIKKRPSFDPLIVHIAGIAEAERYVSDFPAPLRRLAGHFWPGPLTLLLPKKEIIPDIVTSGLDRVALRVPAHPLAQELLRLLDFPLAAPSANPFGYISPTTAQHVADQLGADIPYILDGGPCTVGVESTIIGWDNGQVTVYRLGGMAVEAIEDIAGPVQIQLNQSSNPAAPGMLKSHYAPRKPLFLGDPKVLLPQLEGKRVGTISLQALPLPVAVQEVLSPSGDLQAAARRLFAALRALDQSDVEVIVAQPLPDEGLGRAMNDRLRRAAG